MNGDEWLPGAQDALKQLRELGHKVIIWSCNNPGWIEKQLREAGIAVDHIWVEKGKPLADLYIDDRARAFPYNSSWLEELAKILEDDRVKDKDNRKW